MKRPLLIGFLCLMLAAWAVVGENPTTAATIPMSLTPSPEPTDVPPTSVPTATTEPPTITPTDVPTATVVPPMTAVPPTATAVPPTSVPITLPEPSPTPESTVVPPSVPPPSPTPPQPSEVADPQLSKRIDRTTAGIGDVVTYSIVVVNRGNTTATDVVVSDPLPAFLSYIGASSTRGTPTYASGVVRLDLGALYPDEQVILTIQARINAMPNPMINVASLTTTSLTDNPVNNEDQVSILTVAVSPTRVPPAGQAAPPPAPRFPNTGGAALEIPSLWIVGGAAATVAVLSLLGLLLIWRASRTRYSR